MKIQVRVERNVSECAEIEVESFEELEQIVKENRLFEEVDSQAARKDNTTVWEETCGDILYTRVAIVGDDNEDIAEYDIYEENELKKINQYGEREKDV